MSEMNISGVGAASAADSVNQVNNEETKIKQNEADKNDSNILRSDENEQVAFECTDGKDDGKIGLGQKLLALGKGFGKGFADSIKNLFNLFGKKSSKWEKLSNEQQDLTKKHQELSQEVIDLSKQLLDISKDTAEIFKKQAEEQLNNIDSLPDSIGDINLEGLSDEEKIGVMESYINYLDSIIDEPIKAEGPKLQ